MKYEDLGEIEIGGCDDANIPVNCFLSEPDDDNEKWRWTADNFMPRKGRCGESAYELKAESREVILDLIKKHVVPLYQVALKNLVEKGENYYWH